jgi:hypothetical protein
MTEFSFWDILRNLLLAARWTVLLSLVSFIGGGIVGAALLSCASAAGAGCGFCRAATSNCSRARRS